MDYGGRGITVCDEWATFKRFYADMGPRPNGKSLERIDNDAGYSKANCVWGTKTAQVRNRRVTIRYDDGDGLRSLADLAEKYDLPYKTVWHRHKVGRKGAELFAPVVHGGDRRSGKFAGKQSGLG